MARNPQGTRKHARPENAGSHNIPNIDSYREDEDLPIRSMIKASQIARDYEGRYQGLWSDNALIDVIEAFFEFCATENLKPTQPLFRLYSGISQTTVDAWRYNRQGKFPTKQVIIGKCFDFMEAMLQNRLEKYPTGNIFLLKSSFGHKEQSQLDITTNGESISTSEDVKDLVAKLGLDKE